MFDFKSFDEVKGFFTSKGFKVTDEEVTVCSDHSMKIAAEDKIEQDSISKRLSELKKYSDSVNYLFLYQKDFSSFAFLRKSGEPRKFVYDRKRNYPDETIKSIHKKINGIKYEDDIFNSTIENLFDVKPIVNEFYNKYHIARGKLSKEIDIGDKSTTYAQILLDRIIFIYFLQAKKILKDERYLSNLFYNRDKSRNFFEDYLNPLFFKCFNSEPKNKNEIRKINGIEFGIIPYLNGGLFNKKPIEEENPRVTIKDSIWKDIFDVFNRYEWIVGEEADSNSLTPSILGHIFEKSIHEEERKGTGSYYTPKEITRYIAENTIYPCIVDKVNNFLKENKISKEVKNIEDIFELDKSILNNIKMNNILIKISICDNACGSGAFLLAAAQVLWDIYNKFDEKIGTDKKEFYDIWLKKQIIKNNIYGVDISPDAIEIAKLRLWLWIVESYSIGKIEALPNIDYKIKNGNSLIGFVDLEQKKEISKNTLFNFMDKNISLLDDIVKLKDEYFRTSETEMEKRMEINKKMNPLREKLDKLFFDAINKKEKIIDDFYEYKKELKPFHWGFEFYEIFDIKKPKEERGFDILIGNPPYEVLENEQKKFISIFRSIFNISGDSNLYKMFIMRSIDTMHANSLFGYITPDTFLCDLGSSDIRNVLISNSSFLKLLQFQEKEKVFYGVTQSVCITILKKGINLKNILLSINSSKGDMETKNFISINVDGIKKIFPDELLIPFILSAKDFSIILYLSKYKKLFELSSKSVFQGEVNVSIFKRNITNIRNKHPLIRGDAIGRYSILETTKPSFLQLDKISKKNKRIFETVILERLTGKAIANKSCERRLEFTLLTNVSCGHSSIYIIKNNVDLRYLLLILNSNLLNWYFKKVSSNNNVPVYIIENLLPIVYNANSKIALLSDYMLFLNKVESRREQFMDLIEFMDKQIIDSLIYELYFKEELKTNLLYLIEPYLEGIENINSDNERLNKIKQFYDKVKIDDKLIKEIEKIKNHEWIKVIENG